MQNENSNGLNSVASLMGVSESDAHSFLMAVSFWISKGHNVESAIRAHQSAIASIRLNAAKIADVLKCDDEFVCGLYEKLCVK